MYSSIQNNGALDGALILALLERADDAAAGLFIIE